MVVLGIHDGKDAGVALLDGGRVLFAANEERYSRRKLHFGFPFRALERMFRHTGVRPTDIQAVTVGFEAMVEEDRDVRSTWFIVPERYPVTARDFLALRLAGHEIGVHGLDHSCQTFASREAFERRAPRINRYLREWQVVGFRAPALYRNPDWMPELDVRYDSSFMDTAVLEPQRGGVSAPFPFHLRHVVELPITMPMDHHLIHLLRRPVVPGMLTKLRWVVERFGLANFLFHPDYNLGTARVNDYRQVVDEVRGTPGGWIATAAEIADWWDRRRASRVVLEGDVSRIEGPASADGVL
jgi:peptidoglycan/xylan/chitin deacetylase (PgdA/CDA1 family)